MNENTDKYEYLDDEYDFGNVKGKMMGQTSKFDAIKNKPVNNRMTTLKWVEGRINRYRNGGSK